MKDPIKTVTFVSPFFLYLGGVKPQHAPRLQILHTSRLVNILIYEKTVQIYSIMPRKNTKITLAATTKFVETRDKNRCVHLIKTYLSYALTFDLRKNRRGQYSHVWKKSTATAKVKKCRCSWFEILA